jgi:alpha-mannosidase
MGFFTPFLNLLSRRQLLHGAARGLAGVLLSGCIDKQTPTSIPKEVQTQTPTEVVTTMETQATEIPSASQVLVTVTELPDAALADKRRIYLAPDDHTDYMWSANEANYRQAFLDMLDYYLNLADQTSSEQAPYQSRWNCDGTYWIWVYEKNRTAAQFNRLISRIQDGHITVPLNPLIEVYGGAPTEAILRSMYYAGKLERKYNLSFPLFVPMENQALPLGLGALCAGAGAKYAWKGICQCVTKINDAWDRQYDIYWWTGLDGSRILMKWNSMLNGNASLGGYAEARQPSAAVDFVETNTEFKKRYPYPNVVGIFGKGWDDVKTLTNEFISVAKAKTTSQRQVIVSNEIDFFKDFETTYGSSIHGLSCTFGNEWDIYIAALAEVSSKVKRAVEKLRGAEAVASLVSLFGSVPMAANEADRDQAYINMGLYYEHDWTADGPVSRNERATWQRNLATNISSYADNLFNTSVSMLSPLIKAENTNQYFVFNQLSWQRTDVAYLPYPGGSQWKVKDHVSGNEIASQLVTRSGKQYIQIIAKNMPPLGYKVYEILPEAASSFPNVGTLTGNVVETDLYRYSLSTTGSISSLIDKTQGQREFARSVNGKWINDLGGMSGSYSVEEVGPVSITVKVTGSKPFAHTTRYTLYRDVMRLDIQNEITQNFGQILTWAFGFNLDSPDTWHEELGAILRYKLLANGGHYSPRNARYDWPTLNHFVDMSSGGVGVTLSNADCSFMQVGNSTATVLDDQSPQISVLAGGQVDGTGLGILNQGGDQYFLQRFSLTTHAVFQAASAMRFAMEHQNPLITGKPTGGEQAPLPSTQFSVGQLSDAGVLVWAMKPSEEGGKGLLFRLWNMTGEAKQVDLQLNFIADPVAYEVSHIETRRSSMSTIDNRLSMPVLGNQIKSVIVYTPKPFRGYLPTVREVL